MHWIWNNRTFSTWGAGGRRVQSCKVAQGQLRMEANEPCWAHAPVPAGLRRSLFTVPTAMYIDWIFPLSKISWISPFSESRDLTVWSVCPSVCSSDGWGNCSVGPRVKCPVSAQCHSCFSIRAHTLTMSARARRPHIHNNECKSDNKNFGRWLQWS